MDNEDNSEHNGIDKLGAIANTTIGIASMDAAGNVPRGPGIIGGAVEFGSSLAAQSTDGLTPRDVAETVGEVTVGGVVGSMVAGALRGVAGGPLSAIGGAAFGFITGPAGKKFGGLAYDAIVDMHTPREDPAGGSGKVSNVPGSASVPGYEGRFEDGKGLRYGDELNTV